VIFRHIWRGLKTALGITAATVEELSERALMSDRAPAIVLGATWCAVGALATLTIMKGWLL
jgi:hypothetical protein